MAEDSQADYVNVPSGQKRRWATPAQKILLLLVGLNMLGLIVERWLIYNLHEKIEVISLCMSSLSVCQNLFNPQESVQQGVATISPVGLNESREILNRTEPIQQRTFAHLHGAYMSWGENSTAVLQWRRRGGESVLNNMGYNNGRLLVQKEGVYYIYSKVTVNAAEECSLILHKVLKVVPAYDIPQEIMKSKSFRCGNPPGEHEKYGEILWNSFLAGIVQLHIGDEIFVTLENSHISPGRTENFMGAFMI